MSYILRATSSLSLHVNNPYSDSSESQKDFLSLQVKVLLAQYNSILAFFHAWTAPLETLESIFNQYFLLLWVPLLKTTVLTGSFLLESAFIWFYDFINILFTKSHCILVE